MSQRADVTVKIRGDVARDAKIVAAIRGLTLASYLTETLQPLVDRDLRKALQDRSSEHQKLDSETAETATIPDA